MELAPDRSEDYKLLGCCEEELGNLKKAREWWLRGMERTADKAEAGACAENLAISELKAGHYERAVYFIKWADSIAKARPGRDKVRKGVYRDASQHLTDRQFAYLGDKNTGFSMEDLDKFTSGRMAQASEAAPALSEADPFDMKRVCRDALAEAEPLAKHGLQKRVITETWV